MKDVLNQVKKRWYWGVIVAVVINYFTEFAPLKLLKIDWRETLIVIETLTIILLLMEFYFYVRRHDERKNQLSDSDKRIIISLIQMLDVPYVTSILKEHNSWYGYDRSFINKLRKFAHYQGQLENKITNTEVENILSRLKIRIDEFTSYTALNMSPMGDPDCYHINVDKHDDYERRKHISDVINKDADEVYKELETAVKYLKLKHII